MAAAPDIQAARAEDAAGAIARLVARWPGPAAYVAAGGRVVAANAAAGPVLAMLAAAEGGLANLAAAGEARVLEQQVIPASPRAATFEIALVPLDDGVLVTARDVSLATNVRAALADSRRRYKDFVEISSDFAWETDAAGAFVFVSPRGALGFAASELIGRSAHMLLVEDGNVPADAAASPFTTRERLEGYEVWARDADGALRRLAISALPLHDDEGNFIGARGICRDLTLSHAQEAAHANAANRERLLAFIARTIRDEVDPGAMLGTAAATLARSLGAQGCIIWRYDDEGLRRAAEAGDRPPADLNPEDVIAPVFGADRPNAVADDSVIERETAHGRMLAICTRYQRLVNGAIALWRGLDRAAFDDADRRLLVDVAGQIGIAQAQVAQHEALARLARTDAMTGLLNRRSFVEELARRLAQAKRTGRRGALLYVDLDNFKPINDRFGHQRGDEALKFVAARLASGSRAGDLVARLGGDEFALWLEETDEAGAVAKAKKLLALNGELATFSGDAARPLSLSIGIVVHAGGDDGPEALIARADAAMYRVKHAGKGGFVIAAAA
ncbi:MAG TPA: diguanylate cyclase [Alphaproteobacteria bacterium]